MRKRCLVTGGAGFIGSHIVARLVGEGELVRVVDNLSTGQPIRLKDVRDSIEFVEADLAEERVSDEVVKGVDYVLHQAAVPSVQRSIGDPIATNQANVTATLNILESCRKANVRRLVYAASSSAYGDTEVLPKAEGMSPNPLSPYALQKFVGERYCKLYYDLYGLETVSLRYFNVFGPGQDPHSEYSAVIPKFITKLLAKEPITANSPAISLTSRT
jgi:nucleoside-diphosphate-sugar epimerase